MITDAFLAAHDSEFRITATSEDGTCREFTLGEAASDCGAFLCGNQPVCRVHAMTWPRWFRRAVRNRHRHAIEQASRRWRGDRRADSGRTRRKFDFRTGSRSCEMGYSKHYRRPPQVVSRGRDASWNGSTGGSSTRKSVGVPSCRRSLFVMSVLPKRSLGTDTAALVARRRSRAGGI